MYYAWQYTDIRDGSVKIITSYCSESETIDSLFLPKFRDYSRSELGRMILTKSGDDYPTRISDLLSESLQLFKDMKFTILEGESDLKKTIGMSKWLISGFN